MKRNWDVIRQILERLEACESTTGLLNAGDVKGYDTELVSYHMWLLIEAGLITGKCAESGGSPMVCFGELLTWEGHELLSRIRSPHLWNRITAVAREKGLELSFEVVKTIAKVALEGLLR